MRRARLLLVHELRLVRRQRASSVPAPAAVGPVAEVALVGRSGGEHSRPLSQPSKRVSTAAPPGRTARLRAAVLHARPRPERPAKARVSRRSAKTIVEVTAEPAAFGPDARATPLALPPMRASGVRLRDAGRQEARTVPPAALLPATRPNKPVRLPPAPLVDRGRRPTPRPPPRVRLRPIRRNRPATRRKRLQLAVPVHTRALLQAAQAAGNVLVGVAPGRRSNG